MQMEKAPSLRRKALYAGAALTVAAAGITAAGTPSWAAVTEDVATVSPASGKVGGGNSISVTSTGTNFSFIQGTTRVVFAAAATCPDDYTPGAGLSVAPTSPDLRVVSATKLAVTVPAAVGDGSGSTTAGLGTGTNEWSVCAYNGTTTDSLVAGASAGYVVGPVPQVTSVTPSAGPSQGGGTLVINGTNLDGTTTFTLGGVDIVTSGNATRRTATIPARVAGGPYSLVVARSGGGTTIFPNAFTYTNGVTVTPNTSPNTKARTDISVTGVGFSSNNFATTTGATPNDSNSHVYLVRGVYDPTKSGLSKTNGAVTECLNVLAISDTELVCSLYLSGGGVPQNVGRTVTGTLSGTTLTAANGNFGPGDIGLAITGPSSLGTGIYITSITDPTRAVVNKAPTTALTTAGTITLTAGRSNVAGSDLTLTNNSANVTIANTAITAADIGRQITGTNIPEGTTILTVPNSTTATLSNPATGAASGSYTIGTSPMNAVPNGTYTVTVVSNGGIDVQPGGTNANANYSKSIISSGSTFTVADY